MFDAFRIKFEKIALNIAKRQMKVAGLFAGIGGFELGFSCAGHDAELICEIDGGAQSVLSRHFPGIPLAADVTKLRSLPEVDIIAAGFPCQNLSLAGNNDGIFGAHSGLVGEVFRLVQNANPRWLVLENVPFMLWQKKGEAIRHVTGQLEALGFRWAYRVVDTRAFGIPQRRRRVLFVASRTEDPRGVLFADDAGPQELSDDGLTPCGFSWTEGRAGLGWAVNAVPTLKGGSAIGIPSPPAIWFRRDGRIATPDIRDAERLQGFASDWTSAMIEGKPIRPGARWKLVGNAVSVPVAEWLGRRLESPGQYDPIRDSGPWTRSVWPNAAWGGDGLVHPVAVSEWPERHSSVGLEDFLGHPTKPLSAKATAGFLSRARAGSLHFVDGFLEGVECHLQAILSTPTSTADQLVLTAQ